METRTITHKTGGKTYTVTVSEATALQGMRHTIMVSDAIAAIQSAREKVGDDEPIAPAPMTQEELALNMLRRYAWSDCMACVVGSKSGLDCTQLTFADFCNLPEAFVAKWQQAARELNPHWYAEAEPDEEEKKKEDEPKS
jgi:hypothetical protein